MQRLISWGQLNEFRFLGSWLDFFQWIYGLHQRLIIVCGLVLDSINKKPDLLLHFFGNEIPLIIFLGNAVSGLVF